MSYMSTSSRTDSNNATYFFVENVMIVGDVITQQVCLCSNDQRV